MMMNSFTSYEGRKGRIVLGGKMCGLVRALFICILLGSLIGGLVGVVTAGEADRPAPTCVNGG
jgi:hypothetical protein